MTRERYEPCDHPDAHEWHCLACGEEWEAPGEGEWNELSECGQCGDLGDEGPLPEDWEPEEENDGTSD